MSTREKGKEGYRKIVGTRVSTRERVKERESKRQIQRGRGR